MNSFCYLFRGIFIKLVLLIHRYLHLIGIIFFFKQKKNIYIYIYIYIINIIKIKKKIIYH